MFFKRAVQRLRLSGHDILCTSRQYREAVELARIKKLGVKIVGTHGGADRYSKLRMGASRTYELAEVVQKFGPDVALSFSSPEAARVAYGLGIRHIAFNDSPHSEAVARLSIPLSSKLYCPWVIPYAAWRAYGIAPSNIVKYHALDPAAWLKNESPGGRDVRTPSKILIRLEESKASYMADKGLATEQLVDTLVEKLHSSAEILILCRYQDQLAEIEARHGSKVEVLDHVVDGTALLRSTGLFVGAGGTMTAEAALLGVPTISITPFGYHVEKYLVRTGLVNKAFTPSMLVKLATRMRSDKKFQQEQRSKAERVLRSMEDPTDRMISAVNSVRL